MDLAERSVDSNERHPWEVARFQFFRRVLEQCCHLDEKQSCLDVGAGDAWFAQQLVQANGDLSHVVCWDINYEPEQLSELRAIVPRSFEVTNARPEGRFDILLLLDVLEHVSDDRSFLKELVDESLSPDGIVLISVPAYQALFSNHDRFLRHYRRYSPSQCRALIDSTGLKIDAQGGLFHSLLPVRAAQVVLERWRPSPTEESEGVGTWRAGKGVTRALVAALGAEAALSLRLGMKQRVLPGLSYWAVARRV